MNIFFHGNFESEEDWSFLGSQWTVFPLWEFLRQGTFKNWEDFSDVVVKNFRNSGQKIEHAAGYSLGGRILLNLMCSGLEVEKCSFISTHPGLTSEQERTERVWGDLKWREKVLQLPWETVGEEWNSQEIFARDLNTLQSFSRLENYRSEIAGAFDLLSLGRMRNFFEITLGFEAQWICGELDTKFLELGERFVRRNPLDFKPFPGASHRIHKKDPWGLLKLLNTP